jgi:hypothetical protein
MVPACRRALPFAVSIIANIPRDKEKDYPLRVRLRRNTQKNIIQHAIHLTGVIVVINFSFYDLELLQV